MSKQIEALKLALEFLERPAWRHEYALANINQASTAIKEALAQPEQETPKGWKSEIWKSVKQQEQEPVAWMFALATRKGDDGYSGWENRLSRDKPNVHPQAIRHLTPLYTTPQRTWVGLTDEDWDEIFGNALTIGEAIKVTEAKLKEKNT